MACFERSSASRPRATVPPTRATYSRISRPSRARRQDRPTGGAGQMDRPGMRRRAARPPRPRAHAARGRPPRRGPRWRRPPGPPAQAIATAVGTTRIIVRPPPRSSKPWADSRAPRSRGLVGGRGDAQTCGLRSRPPNRTSSSARRASNAAASSGSRTPGQAVPERVAVARVVEQDRVADVPDEATADRVGARFVPGKEAHRRGGRGRYRPALTGRSRPAETPDARAHGDTDRTETAPADAAYRCARPAARRGAASSRGGHDRAGSARRSSSAPSSSPSRHAARAPHPLPRAGRQPVRPLRRRPPAAAGRAPRHRMGRPRRPR